MFVCFDFTNVAYTLHWTLMVATMALFNMSIVQHWTFIIAATLALLSNQNH